MFTIILISIVQINCYIHHYALEIYAIPIKCVKCFTSRVSCMQGHQPTLKVVRVTLTNGRSRGRSIIQCSAGMGRLGADAMLPHPTLPQTCLSLFSLSATPRSPNRPLLSCPTHNSVHTSVHLLKASRTCACLDPYKLSSTLAAVWLTGCGLSLMRLTFSTF